MKLFAKKFLKKISCKERFCLFLGKKALLLPIFRIKTRFFIIDRLFITPLESASDLASQAPPEPLPIPGNINQGQQPTEIALV